MQLNAYAVSIMEPTSTMGNRKAAMSNRRLFVCFSTSLLILSCSKNPEQSEIPANLTFKIINEYPHNTNAFTQGLVYNNGFLYEGTGKRGSSTLRRVDLKTGEVLQNHQLSQEYFGEGVTIYEDKIIQLTLSSHIAFVYDRASFEPLKEFSYPTQGWGITHDGERLIMSDGTATIYFRNPETFEEIGQLQVFDDSGPVTRLNELEFLKGKIYANIWLTDRIAIISPESGEVLQWVDLTGLLSEEEVTQPVDVLNGIAYHAATDRLFVTGKLWPKLFEIELVPQ